MNDFDAFWQTVENYAKELGVTTQYIEEEFVLDGELIKVELNGLTNENIVTEQSE